MKDYQFRTRKEALGWTTYCPFCQRCYWLEDYGISPWEERTCKEEVLVVVGPVEFFKSVSLKPNYSIRKQKLKSNLRTLLDALSLKRRLWNLSSFFRTLSSMRNWEPRFLVVLYYLVLLVLVRHCLLRQQLVKQAFPFYPFLVQNLWKCSWESVLLVFVIYSRLLVKWLLQLFLSMKSMLLVKSVVMARWVEMTREKTHLISYWLKWMDSKILITLLFLREPIVRTFWIKPCWDLVDLTGTSLLTFLMWREERKYSRFTCLNWHFKLKKILGQPKRTSTSTSIKNWRLQPLTILQVASVL